MYNVLWLDDEFNDEEMVHFAIEAESKGFQLFGFTSFEEAFDELDKNLDFFDIILLDGMFYENKDQVKGTEDEVGIGMAIARIYELRTKREFLVYVLSGKHQFTKGANSFLKANKLISYDKTSPDDVVRLFDNMTKDACNKDYIQLKNKYQNILILSEDKYLGRKCYSTLIDIINKIESNVKLTKTEDMFLSLRKTVELLFSRLADYGVIPKTIIEDRGSLNNSSRYLSKMHNEYVHEFDDIYPVVTENIFRLLRIVQDASHASNNLELKVDEYLRYSNTDYLFKSCSYLLFDILVWSKGFIDNNNDINENKSKWKKISSLIDEEGWIYGKVSQIAENGYGTFQSEQYKESISITPIMVKENSLCAGQSVQIKTKPNSDNSKIHICKLKTS